MTFTCSHAQAWRVFQSVQVGWVSLPARNPRRGYHLHGGRSFLAKISSHNSDAINTLGALILGAGDPGCIAALNTKVTSESKLPRPLTYSTISSRTARIQNRLFLTVMFPRVKTTSNWAARYLRLKEHVRHKGSDVTGTTKGVPNSIGTVPIFSSVASDDRDRSGTADGKHGTPVAIRGLVGKECIAKAEVDNPGGALYGFDRRGRPVDVPYCPREDGVQGWPK